MKGFLPTFALLFLLTTAVTAALPPDDRFDPVLGNLGTPTVVHELSLDQARDLLSLAVRQQWNLFDLLDETGLYLKPRGLRISVSGAVLRDLTSTFRLGDNRVDTLLPLDQLLSLSLGSRTVGGCDVEILLGKPVSGYLELGDFGLATRYGFKEIKEKALEGAFGVTVKNGLFTWNLKAIARVPDPRGLDNPNFIAIYLDNFFRPKRWEIDPVRFRPGPTPRP